MNIVLRQLLIGASGAAILSGCMVGPNFHTPAPPEVDRYTPAPLPNATSPGSSEAAERFVPGAPVQAGWWKLFGSPQLDVLEQEALKNNSDLHAAQAALRQAHEVYLAERASLFPTVQLAANAMRARNSATIAPPLADNSEIYSLFTAQLNVAYTPDVFGGERRQIESVGAQAENQRFQTEAVYLTLTANVANTVLQLAGLNAQLDATRSTVEADRKVLETTRHMQALGEASSADVAAAGTTLAQAQQLLPPIQKQIHQQTDLLAILVGRPPSNAPTDRFDISGFRLPEELPVSLPSDLVRQRPDILAAEANLHSASALVGVAIAARLPSFPIEGSAGSASGTVAGLFSSENGLWSITGSVAQTVFDAGALRHKQAAAYAALDQAKAQYRSAVLGGLQNTADALQVIIDDADLLRHAQAAETAAAQSLQIAQTQFGQGQVGALSVLNAEAASGQAEVSLAQARAARYADAVALFQALGGGWWNRDAAATVSKP